MKVSDVVVGGLLLVVGTLAAGAALQQPAPPPAPTPAPVVPAPKPAPVCPGPDCPDCPKPPPKPKRPRPWGPRGCSPVGEDAQNRTDPSTGRDVQIDLPKSQHLRNLPDGGGCCTFASMDHAARWHNIKPLIGVLNDRLGGGYPSKIASTVQRRYPGYLGLVQAEGRDTCTRLLDAALPAGRMGCVTWGRGHMVNCVHLDAERGAILDNNRPGVFQWFSRQKTLEGILQGGWVYVFMEPPPPPVPTSPAKGD